MTAADAKVGEKYLTKSGIPVTATRRDGDKLVLRVETTGNETKVEKSYPLQTFAEGKVNQESKMLLKANGKSKTTKSSQTKREGTLAHLIAPMLASGKFTVKEIAAELKKKAGALANGKDLEANVRAACFAAKRRGYTVERDAENRIRVIARAQNAR